MPDVKDEALLQIKAVYDDGKATINGRDYTFNKMMFGERRAVFAYTSSVQNRLSTGDFSFLDEPKFKHIEDIINRNVTLDGMTLSKKNPFEEHVEDYVMFISTALGVISYPFLNGDTGK